MTTFEFEEPSMVVPGTIGQPGQRTFFIQVSEGIRTCSFKVEKQQVAALCEYLDGILADLPPAGDIGLLSTPIAEDPLGLLWPVGRLAVAYEDADDRIVVVAEELIEIDDDLEIDFDDPDALTAAGLDPSTARIRMSRAQVAAFIAVGNDLVRAGRPACRLCGRPIDPEGHACPRLN